MWLNCTNYLYITVGNKNDCPERKVVQTEDATKFAEQIGIQLFETSAKENLNVEEASTAVIVFTQFVVVCIHNS